MENVCKEHKLGSFLSWECYHGVGHALMYYRANDLSRSLEQSSNQG